MLLCRVAAFVVVGVVMLGLGGCRKSGPGVEDPQRSMYYWRTTFSLDDEERQFLRDAEVGRLYLRLFDVVRDAKAGLRPGGTLMVKDSMPQGVEIVPVVFIEPGALRDSTGVGNLPNLIVNRVGQMLTQNNIEAKGELQLDYDWTGTDQQAYFCLLQGIMDILHQRGSKLSVTVRLHQLSLPVPPADYGVLMVYNTDNLKSPDVDNSILSEESVAPYMQKLNSYGLPLCTALPIYSWDLLFHTGHFRQIVKGIDVFDKSAFERLDSVRFRSLNYMAAPTNGVVDDESGRIFPGDIIRHEMASPECLRNVKKMLVKHRSTVCDQIILYHLDRKSIKQYKTDEIKDIFAEP